MGKNKSFINFSKFSWLPWLAFILLITFLVYWPVLQNDFLKTWDDDRYILENPHIQKLNPTTIGKMFTIYYDGHYHPLTLFSLAIDYQIGSLSPQTYHTSNLILHLINTLLVFWFIFLLFKKKNTVIPLVSALLFGICTMHVETVAWASERKNLLYAFFFFVSIIAYLYYIEKNKKWLYVLSILLFLFSILSKVMAISLFVTFVLVDFYYDRKLLSRKVIVEKIPFFILAVLFGIVAIFAQTSSWGEDLSQTHYSFFERILFAGFAFIMYLVKLIIPFKLSGFYPYPEMMQGLIIFRNVLFVLLSLFIVFVGFYLRKKSKVLFFGILFFASNIFLLLKLFEVPAGDYIMADRYGYIPSIGLFLIMAYGLENLFRKNTSIKRIGQGLLILYTIFIALQTFNRVSVWKDDVSFYSDIISKYPKAEVAYTNRGAIRKESRELQSALADFNKAIQLGKKDFKAYSNRGAVYTDLGEYQMALNDYQKAISLKPNHPQVLADYGYAQLNTGDIKGAISTFDKTIRIKNYNPEVYNNRGTAKFKMGDLRGAIRDYEAASTQNPDYLNAHYNRGLARINLGEYQKSISDFLLTLKIEPGYAEAYSNMGVAWSQLGDMQKAFESYDKAIQIRPGYFEAWLNRGVDKYYSGDYEGALVDINKSIQLNPNLAPAYYFRALIKINSDRNMACNDLDKAISLGFQAAIQLKENNCK
ncbi:MAG: tetratricopeptide repeat protein [Bacteroidales bacterium]|nr:tetratricopeptide repeat protein [Bacteroidales bacterium]